MTKIKIENSNKKTIEMEKNENCTGISIKPIRKDVIHQICSGQVILSLAVAVKELVENSIDAGASIIELTLDEFGSESIEVNDNGQGVHEQNFQALTLKHYTSKIDNFSDLQFLETLGFRGEALSSLCALANLSIVTKHATADQATKIIYDKDGKIIEKSLAARQVGTTVKLENLFSSLPVRRKEFIKNLKREFSKMCQLLNAYCLVSKGIKFTCTNKTRNKKNLIVATQGHNTVKENIISVFGAKQISSLIEIDIVRPNQEILDEYNIQFDENEDLPIEMEFLISTVTHGNGRNSTDRQFFYVNSRPVEPIKIIKLVNQMYKQFNNSQYPFVYLNILVKSSAVDVNVTPDKRQIFLEKEKLILSILKASLIEAFKVFPSQMPLENKNISQMLGLSKSESGKGLKRSLTDSQEIKKEFFESFKKKHKSENDAFSHQENSLLASFTIRRHDKDDSTRKVLKDDQRISVMKQEFTSSSEKESVKLIQDTGIESIEKLQINMKSEEGFEKIDEGDDMECNKNDSFSNKNSAGVLENEYVEENKIVNIILDSQLKKNRPKRYVHCDVTLKDIKDSVKKKQSIKVESENIKIKFRSTISPENNEKAEEELQKQLSKSDFSDMKVIGQFNLGFIITRLHNDLFIVDQHATDEKYNFEKLQASTVLQKQVLVNPKPLELTAGNESILIENEEIFKKNGFHFKINEDAPVTKRVMLTAIPVSQNYVFGKDDIDEMLFMLKDSSHTMCRPSRVRAMFASRACRKSVMIGKSLSNKDMKILVEHMGEIDQPWNCPHGRPTIRHLLNMDLINKDEEV